jgi:hypothetical protein
MPVDVNWNRPPGCGNSCKYSIEYKAPALECKDMGSDQVGPLVTLNDDGSIKDRYWYNTSTTLVPTGTVDLQKPYTLNIAYSNITGAVSVEPDHLTMLVGIDRPIGSGTTCTFRNATYAADFEFANNTRVVRTKVVQYGNFLGQQSGACDEEEATEFHVLRSRGSRIDLSECVTYMVNTRATCEAFANAFSGQITDLLVPMANPLVLNELFDMKLPSWDALRGGFQVTVGASFNLKVANLSQTLMDLFSNVTLGIMTLRNDETIVIADTWSGQSVWVYNPKNLWLIYGPAILTVCLIGLYGIYCVHSNGVEMDTSFSYVLMTTRNEELDMICRTASSTEGIKEYKLKWEDGIFMPEGSSYRHEKV